MHTIKENTHAYGVVDENINSVDIGHSESKKWKESPNLSTLNDASMPNSFFVCSASGMPQVSSLDILAVTYGDSVDSDEDEHATHLLLTVRRALMKNSMFVRLRFLLY